MLHVPHANDFRSWLLFIALGVAGNLVQRPDQTLDLAAVPKSERHSLGIPGSSIGGTSDGHIFGPERYKLPLKVKIEKIQARDRATLLVQIELQNMGTQDGAPFKLPSCVDERKAHGNDQLDRRTLEIRFGFSDNPLKPPMMITGDVTFGAATVPECLISIAPGGTAHIVLEIELPPEIREVPAGNSRLQLSAVLEELTLENKKFQVSSRSQEIRSDPVHVAF